MQILSKYLFLGFSVCLLAACEQTARERPSATVGHGSQDERRQAKIDEALSQKKPQKELTSAEIAALPRDQRRAKYLEGFSCEWMFQGQPAYTRYTKGRVAYGHHEGETTSSWKIQDDRICFVTERNKKTCYNLPKKDLPGGESEFLKIFQKGCI